MSRLKFYKWSITCKIDRWNCSRDTAISKIEFLSKFLRRNMLERIGISCFDVSFKSLLLLQNNCCGSYVSIFGCVFRFLYDSNWTDSVNYQLVDVTVSRYVLCLISLHIGPWICQCRSILDQGEMYKSYTQYCELLCIVCELRCNVSVLLCILCYLLHL